MITTPTRADQALASTVALRLDRPAEQCAAWLEQADRVCGKEVVRPWLCKRHVTVAERRLAKVRARAEEQVASARRRAQEARPRWEARLTEIDARLAQIDPFRDGGADRAAACAPLRQRLPSDSRIAELARLHEEREHLAGLIG